MKISMAQLYVSSGIVFNFLSAILFESFFIYLGDTRPEFRIVGGASKISVCFSGNISVSHN